MSRSRSRRKMAGRAGTVFLLAATVFQLQGVQAFQWVSPLEDGATINACINDTVRFPWNISLDSTEEVTFIQLFRNSTFIAMYAHEVYNALADRIDFTREQGLKAIDVVPADSGTYAVEITIRNGTSSSSTTYRRTAFLLIATESSATADATVTVKQEQVAVLDKLTGQYHVRLTCRSQGRPPSAVIWRTPTGVNTTVSTHDENGMFSLLLPNPVSGGRYTCRVDPRSAGARCLDPGNTLLQGATVEVSLIEAEMTTLRNENHELRTENADLKSHVDHLEGSLAVINRTESGLLAENQHLKDLVNSLQQQLGQHLHSGDGVTATTTTAVPVAVGCADALENCTHYRMEDCCAYQPWFRAHCASFCGFCGVVPDRRCVDVINYCDRTEADLCSNDKWRLFREENCAGYCHVCDEPWRPPNCTAHLFPNLVSVNTTTRPN